MILYHGSSYTTSLYEQAQNWCARFTKTGKSGVISQYHFDDTAFMDLYCLFFDSYNEDWLDFVLTCRRGADKTTYDIVSGGVANDRVFNTMQLYLEGLIEKSVALKRLRYEKPNAQICFRTFVALDYLSFEGSEHL